jgi:hypothetical protein
MESVSKKVSSLMIALIVMLNSGQALADDALRLNLQMKQGLQAGTVKDGTSIGRGTLVNHDTHTGFRLWAVPLVSLTRPGYYVLTGKQSGIHKLRIRLVPRGLSVNDKPGSAEMILNTGCFQIAFDVLADGDQKVDADSYVLSLSAAPVLF